MIERGISEHEVEEAIRCGSKVIEDNKLIAVFRYYQVVYQKIDEDEYIITVMLR